MVSALRQRGAAVRAAPWDTITNATDPATLICLRSTWDYHLRPAQFREWVHGLSAVPSRLWNPAATVIWNLDKIYLRDLAARGIPIPRTVWFEPGEEPDVAGCLAERGWTRAVLKPRVSATAYGTHLITHAQAIPRAPVDSGVGAMLQEYLADVEVRGEISLVYLGGALSHAVRKLPRTGDFRSQLEFGGSLRLIEAPRALARFGDNVMSQVAHAWMYARVDLVETAQRPVLMELELIEPDLFFTLAPHGARRLANALAGPGPGSSG